MSTCVVITAAGRCTRMGCFKPMMPINGRPAVVHLLDTYFSAGVDHAIIVTGFQQEKLCRICSGIPNLTFVRNTDYMTTQMFDSIRLGLSAVPENCDTVLLTPVDIPLVSRDTVQAVLRQSGRLVFPSHNRRRGHPLKVSHSLLPAIQGYHGDRGLKGALATLHIEPQYAEVNDPFILMDMDTLREYSALIQSAGCCEVK